MLCLRCYLSDGQYFTINDDYDIIDGKEVYDTLSPFDMSYIAPDCNLLIRACQKCIIDSFVTWYCFDDFCAPTYLK